MWSGGSPSATTASAAIWKLCWAATNSFLEKRCSPRSISIWKGAKGAVQGNETKRGIIQYRKVASRRQCNDKKCVGQYAERARRSSVTTRKALEAVRKAQVAVEHSFARRVCHSLFALSIERRNFPGVVNPCWDFSGEIRRNQLTNAASSVTLRILQKRSQ